MKEEYDLRLFVYFRARNNKTGETRLVKKYRLENNGETLTLMRDYDKENYFRGEPDGI